MTLLIVRLQPDADQPTGPWYVEWDTDARRPVSRGMTRTELDAYFILTRRANQLTTLQARVDRADRWGTSAPDIAIEEVIAGNQLVLPPVTGWAEMTMREIVELFVINRERLPRDLYR